MRTFFDGCLTSFLVMVFMLAVAAGIVGCAALLFWGLVYHTLITALVIFGVCVISGGIEAWWEEREAHKYCRGDYE